MAGGVWAARDGYLAGAGAYLTEGDEEMILPSYDRDGAAGLAA